MRTSRTRSTAVTAVVVATAALAFASPPDNGCLDAPAVGERCPSWVSVIDRDDPNRSNDDDMTAVVTSPDDGTVYAAGSAHLDAVVVVTAHDVETGAARWHTVVDRSREDDPQGVALSPDGSSLAVVGTSFDLDTGRDAFVFVLDTTDGAIRWRHDHAGPQGEDDEFWGVAWAGDTVVVSGIEDVGGQRPWAAPVMAFDDASGEQRWSQRHTGGALSSFGVKVSPSPDATVVHVMVDQRHEGGGTTATPIAIDVDTGQVLWESAHARFDPSFGRRPVLDVADDGTVVMAYNSAPDGDAGGVTVRALDPLTGATIWADRWAPDGGESFARDPHLSVDGDGVFVAATFSAATAGVSGISGGAVAIGHDLASGDRDWVTTLPTTPRGWTTRAVAVGPSGVWVTGDDVAGQGFAAHDARTTTLNRTSGAVTADVTYNASPAYDAVTRPLAMANVDGGVAIVGQAWRSPAQWVGDPGRPSATFDTADGFVLVYR